MTTTDTKPASSADPCIHQWAGARCVAVQAMGHRANARVARQDMAFA
jgi:hypothetical protein